MMNEQHQPIKISRESKVAGNSNFQPKPEPEKTDQQDMTVTDVTNIANGAVAVPAIDKIASEKSSQVGATSVSTLVANKTTDVISLLTAGISPFSPGSTIVAVHQASLLPHVRHSMTDLAVAMSTALGIPMPNVESVLSVFSGNKRQLEQAEFFAAVNPLPTTGASHDFKTCAALDTLDWTSNEGQYLLLPLIAGAKGRWVIVEQEISGSITPTIAQGLIRIDHAARQAGVYVLLMIACSDRMDVSQLAHVCGDLIEVARCEPDVDCDTAFSIDCVGIRNLNSLGIGKTMCSVKLTDGVFHRRYERFVAADLDTRIMRALRGLQKSQDEIGSLFKINKSTVLRRLQGLPIPRPEEVDQDWLDRNLEALPSKSS